MSAPIPAPSAVPVSSARAHASPGWRWCTSIRVAVKMEVKLKEGIEHEMAKKIVKLIKDAGLKVQAAIQDELVRLTGKKIDDLLEVIAAVLT